MRKSPGIAADRGAFKTPTLRDISSTAPYMHDGSLLTLREVVDYYDRGGNVNPALDAELRPLRLTGEEKNELDLRVSVPQWLTYVTRAYRPRNVSAAPGAVNCN